MNPTLEKFVEDRIMEWIDSIPKLKSGITDHIQLHPEYTLEERKWLFLRGVESIKTIIKKSKLNLHTHFTFTIGRNNEEERTAIIRVFIRWKKIRVSDDHERDSFSDRQNWYNFNSLVIKRMVGTKNG